MIKQFIFAFVLLTLVSCNRKAIENTTLGYYNYEAAVVEVGRQGHVVIKSWGKATNVKGAREAAKKNAVHALLFKGLNGSENVASTDLRPLLTEANAEQRHRDYFTAFFAENGKYTQFVQYTSKPSRAIEAGDIIRTGNSYKVAVTVSVNRTQLIKELEAAGIKKHFGIN